MGNLAINGGIPVCDEMIKPMAWPPLFEETADKLKELYFSRQWSFNCQAEQDFSREFADYHGAKHGIFMANGTVTLECALLAGGIGAGDEVIVPALTWIATAMVVRYVGAIPVFVDIDPETLCMDPEKMEAAITAKTKAVIPVHLYGSMADIDKIKEITDKHGLFLIEDCAHMQGGKWNERGVGSWGDVGSFSFQQSKTLSCGEGGICITNDDKLADLIYRAKHIGYDTLAWQGGANNGPPVDLPCHNYRSTGFQALIVSGQLPALPGLLDKYNKNADVLREKVSGITGLRVQKKGRLASPQGYYGMTFLFDREILNDISFQTIIEACRAEGVQLAGTYGPVYQHMLFNLQEGDYRIDGGSCPISEGIGFERAIFMPHPYLGCEKAAVEKIGDIIVKVANNIKELK